MKKHKPSAKERNAQLTDFSGLREIVIQHNAALRMKSKGFETREEADQALSFYFAG